MSSLPALSLGCAFPEKIISRLRELKGTGHDLHTYEMFATAEELAKELNLTEEETKILSAAALVHDIGKTGPLGLSAEERKKIINFFHYLKRDQMKVTVDKMEIDLDEGSTIRDALKKLSLNPEVYIVSRGDEIVHENERLEDGDSLTLIKVISGG